MQKNDFDPGVNAAILNTYPSGFDENLVQYLAQEGIPYSVWKAVPPAAQNVLKNSSTGTTLPGYAPGAGLVPAGGAVQWLLYQYAPTDPKAQQHILAAWTHTAQNNANIPPAPPKLPSTKATTSGAGAGLVQQPHAAGSTGGAGGVPGGFGQPRQTGGELARELKSMGYHFPFDISGMIQKAIQVSNGDATTSMSAFLSTLYDSKQFKHYYPNYFSPSGTARFGSPADYDKQVLAYQTAASRQGFKVDRNLAGQLIAGDVSAQEYQDRVGIAAQIKNNIVPIANFNAAAAAAGVKGIKTAQDAFAFLAGRADPKSYQVWNAAAARTAAQSAGLQETTAQAAKATKGLTGAGAYADIEKSYQDIAQQIKDSGAELGSFGLSQGDLETIQFGGSNRAMLAARAQQAMAQTAAQGTLVTGTSAAQVGGAGLPVAAQQVTQAGE